MQEPDYNSDYNADDDINVKMFRNMLNAVEHPEFLPRRLTDNRPYNAFKNLTELANDLKGHANDYILHDGTLVADLKQAINYLEAMANNE